MVKMLRGNDNNYWRKGQNAKPSLKVCWAKTINHTSLCGITNNAIIAGGKLQLNIEPKQCFYKDNNKYQ